MKSTILLLFLPILAAAETFQSSSEPLHLVELFTSEGCSSCPPAENWLSSLMSHPKLFKEFIPLEFHVTYWDYIGWKDPFAKEEYTIRQRRYAREWQARNVYTPNVILNGQDWRAWRSGKIPPKSKSKAGVLKVTRKKSFEFEAEFKPEGAKAKSKNWVVHGALLLNHLASRVTAGENSGRTLKHHFVVAQHRTAQLKNVQKAWKAKLKLKKQHLGRKPAVAFWVTAGNQLKPHQSTGGFLKQKR